MWGKSYKTYNWPRKQLIKNILVPGQGGVENNFTHLCSRSPKRLGPPNRTICQDQPRISQLPGPFLNSWGSKKKNGHIIYYTNAFERRTHINKHVVGNPKHLGRRTIQRTTTTHKNHPDKVNQEKRDRSGYQWRRREKRRGELNTWRRKAWTLMGSS